MYSWLVLGSGPSAGGLLDVMVRETVDVTITTNWGIEQIPNPDYYFVTDMLACKTFQEHARRAKDKGTYLVTLKRSEQAIRERNLGWFDEFIPEGPEWEQFNLSGLWCIEYACKNGASHVHLVGMEGYSKTGEHYYNGRPTRRNNYTLLEQVVQPRMQTLHDKYPEVEFIHHGRPNYQVNGERWMVKD